ncbi:hypothetical protein ACKKBF_B00830 [Auxenochlorella protothecoides x Auxenochlorella symbiontica]
MSGARVLACQAFPTHPAQGPQRPAGHDHRMATRRTLLATTLGAGLLPTISMRSRAGALYDEYAEEYDGLESGRAAQLLGLAGLRGRLASMARGDALEIGAGTGLNLPWLLARPLTSYTALDLSGAMLAGARARLARAPPPPFPVRFVAGDAARLPFPAHSFDCVLSSYALCAMDRPDAALSEALRVLRPGGQLLLLEHARSELWPLSWYQDRTARAVAALSKGCRWDREVGSLVRAAGGEVRALERHLLGTVVLLDAEPRA